ncbi:TetR/AcrR family transcriptional regulator [Streptomyces chumphonensis]|uniref:TetR/AcrR family transcriptional regulator n=1 Tax=Streptomyces chumphonensis TaxID=1214925 RepID=UPI0029653E20|nr:TetR family transcriptional regulator [Streptomyces chumphonensis]
MVRTNPERRAALLHAAIDVLAEEGARGLTFRAVDERAGVPKGTASNYFADRDTLLRQAGQHLFVRLTPDPEYLAERMSRPPSKALDAVLMRDIVERARSDRNGFLAMLELRLEATRRPELREVFTEHYRANLEENVRAHVEGGFPGDRSTVVMLYLAMTGLLVEYLTLPGVLDAAESPLDDLVGSLVDVIVPER